MNNRTGFSTALRVSVCLLAISAAGACDDDASSPTDAAWDAGGDSTRDVDSTVADVDSTDLDGREAGGGTFSEQKLAWVLALLNGPAEALTAETIASHFSPSALMALPAPALAASLLETADELRPFTLLSTAPQRLGLVASLRARHGVHARLSLTVDIGTRTITGLQLQPAPDLDPDVGTFASVSNRLQVVGARTAIAVSALESLPGTAGLTCRTLEARNDEEALPLGSLFKIYVLGAVLDRMERGEGSWTDTFTLQEKWKSLPSGVLQDRPAGTAIAFDDAVAKMISISDNTATDHLIHWLGRERVETQQSVMGHGRPDLNIPFLTTRELFTLKLALSPAERQLYIATSASDRRQQLEGVIANTPVPPDLEARVAAWTAPRDVDTLEWFATTADICRAYTTFATKFDVTAAAPAIRALALNPGLPVDRNTFSYVGYKGGSEPGVLTFSWLLRRRSDNAWRVVTIMASDTARGIPLFTTAYFAQAAVTFAGR
ncbi:MAG TPA: serine hydrolase [Polyangia bacterium]